MSAAGTGGSPEVGPPETGKADGPLPPPRARARGLPGSRAES
jgi:hypothetical protein